MNKIWGIVANAVQSARIGIAARSLACAAEDDAMPRPCYASRSFPGPPASRSQIVMGGEVKMAGLAAAFPHTFPTCDLVYAVSSVGFPGRQKVVDMARNRRVPVVLNQNGVYYPASGGPRWRSLNRPLDALRRSADFIIYQTEFCKIACDTFLGPVATPFTIACNAVDTDFYQPASDPPRLDTPTILALWGAGGRSARTRVTVESFLALRRLMPTAKLILAGYHKPSVQHRETRRAMDELVAAADQPLGCVEYLPRYTGNQAPRIFQMGHVLLHTQPNDNCPHLVVEAMACGIPVVHQDNGGTPQMVTPRAGVAVPSAASWEKVDYPAPESFAAALETIFRDWHTFHQQARARAVEFMSLEAFLREHRRVFGLVCPHLKESYS